MIELGKQMLYGLGTLVVLLVILEMGWAMFIGQRAILGAFKMTIRNLKTRKREADASRESGS